jgi:hypothetical protein
MPLQQDTSTNSLEIPSPGRSHKIRRLRALLGSTRADQSSSWDLNTRNTPQDSASSAGLPPSNGLGDPQNTEPSLEHRERPSTNGPYTSFKQGCSQVWGTVSKWVPERSKPADPGQSYIGPNFGNCRDAFCRVKAKCKMRRSRNPAHTSGQTTTYLSQSTQPPSPMSTTSSPTHNPTSPSANGTCALSSRPTNCQLPDDPNDNMQSSFSAQGLDWPAETYYGPQGYQAEFEDTNPSR